MEFRNGRLLQLFECIESTQNEVKRKMIETGAFNAVPKSHARLAREEKSSAITTCSHLFCHHVVFAVRTLQLNTSFGCRRGGASRTFAKLPTIYNERRFSSDACRRDASSVVMGSASKERNHGRFD